MKKAKAMPKLKKPRLPMIVTTAVWDQYQREMIAYQDMLLKRKDAEIADLERKVKRVVKQLEKARRDFQDWLARS